MENFSSISLRLSRWMNYVGGAVLAFMMFLTVLDVVLRIFGKPILGTYELISLAGAMVVSFAIPKASHDDAHVYVDILVGGLSSRMRRIFHVMTKLLGITFFVLLGINIVQKGNELYGAGEVSLTLHVPLYPAAYAIGFCCLVECMVLLSQIITPLEHGGEHE
jgi:TRAP-type C4-dicarboxylate transport system permease small subunit